MELNLDVDNVNMSPTRTVYCGLNKYITWLSVPRGPFLAVTWLTDVLEVQALKLMCIFYAPLATVFKQVLQILS